MEESLVYGLGILRVSLIHPVTRNLLAQKINLQNGSLEIASTEIPITSGEGDTTDIVLMGATKVTLKATVSDMDLHLLGYSIGSHVTYDATTSIEETILGTSGKLIVTGNAVVELGDNSNEPKARVKGDPVAYVVDKTTRELKGFIAVNGKAYCVEYNMKVPSSQQLIINGRIAPMTCTAIIEQSLYSSVTSDGNSGSYAGKDTYTLPLAQLSPNQTITMGQSAASNTAFTLQALKYVPIGSNDTPCVAGRPILAYIVRTRLGLDFYNQVASIFVIGGIMSLVVANTKQIPLKLNMESGMIQQANFADFDYLSNDPTVATVSATGEVTGVSSGSCEITITHKTIAILTTIQNVIVTI